MLKARGVKKGDRVTIYLPMIPQAAYAMLACARIGAIHSVIFGGFSPDSIAGRIQDCDSRIVITADEGLRGGKPVPLKKNVDEALASCPGVTDVIVVRRTKADKGRMEKRPRTGVPKMKFADVHALKALPEKIAGADIAISRLEQGLADPALFARDPKRFAALSAELADVRAAKHADEERWLALEMEREALETGQD